MLKPSQKDGAGLAVFSLAIISPTSAPGESPDLRLHRAGPERKTTMRPREEKGHDYSPPLFFSLIQEEVFLPPAVNLISATRDAGDVQDSTMETRQTPKRK
jgi:hypothetical protein